MMFTPRFIRRSLRLVPVFATLLLSSCFLLPQEEEILAPPLAEPPQISYRTEAVSRGSLQDTIRAFGSFVSGSQSDLFFDRRGGRLQTMHVSIGDEVAAGDLIADLYTDNIEAEIAQAELDLRRAELALDRARSENGDRFTLEFARADRDLAAMRLEQLREDLAEELELAEVTGAASEQVRDLRRRIAEQEVVLRKAELSLERIQSRETPVSLELARIDVEAARIRLDRLREELDATKLYAPISGRVTWISRQAEEGEIVQAFQRIVRIADPADLVFEYEGREANEFSVGMECTITVGEAEYPGSVILTPTSVPFDQREEFEDTVHIRPAGTVAEARLGTNATARLILAEQEDVLVLPKRAVQRYSTRRYVHVLVNGVRVERDVEVGLETATEVEIVRGLEEGEEVVLR
ncbi:MAG: efflux RND transporter periplasmic adaptor subunit [Spirochaetota bacterium]